MDLAAEARACERIGGYLDTLGIKTPPIHWELTGIRVNVQERLYGTPASAIEAESTDRSEEHTSELQSLMRISSAVFCLKKKKTSSPLLQIMFTINTTTRHKNKPNTVYKP